MMLCAYHISGQLLYAVLLDTAAQAWNGSAWETLNAESWGDYAILLTESVGGIYLADLPISQEAGYSYVVYQQLGEAPAVSDRLVGSGYAADPWAGELPGSYTEGQAGHMLGTLWDRMVDQVPGDGPVVVIPAPSEATQTVAYAYCYDRNGAPQEGVTLTIQIATSETTGGGATYSRQLITAVSDENGLATVEIPRGSHLAFRARRGSGPWMQFAGVDAANVQIPYLVSHTAEIIEAP